MRSTSAVIIVVLKLACGLPIEAQEFVAGGTIDAHPSAARGAGDEHAIDETVLYEREDFQYSGAGRRDPFRSPLLEGVGVRIEDLSLRGIIHDPVAMTSIAVLSQAGLDRRIRLRVGEQLAGVRIISIHTDRVEVLVEELGVSKRETLRLVRSQTGATP